MKLTSRRLGLSVISLLLGGTSLSAAVFTTGDVFASKQGSVREYSPTGVFQQGLTSGIAASNFTTGAAFDSAGNYFVTNFGSGTVLKFANTAANTQTVFASGFSTPEDILIDSSGNFFISELGGGGLRRFNSSGVLQQQWATGHRIDWFDLDSSESTMYYTDESGTIHRWNLTTNTALSDLCTNCGRFALRLLGDGTLLVAAGTTGVNRVNATTGAIVQSYSAASLGSAGEWFALNLDPDGTTFWTGNDSNDNLSRANIATGALISTFNSGSAGESLFGVAVLGERTVTNTVPEPASLVLLGTMLSGVAIVFRRKYQSKA